MDEVTELHNGEGFRIDYSSCHKGYFMKFGQGQNYFLTPANLNSLADASSEEELRIQMGYIPSLVRKIETEELSIMGAQKAIRCARDNAESLIQS